MKRSQKGFTLHELRIVIFLVCILAIIVSIPMVNLYYTQSGILQEVKVDYPDVVKILKDDRGIFNSSILFEKSGGERIKLCLDTNLLFNYDFSDCD